MKRVTDKKRLNPYGGYFVRFQRRGEIVYYPCRYIPTPGEGITLSVFFSSKDEMLGNGKQYTFNTIGDVTLCSYGDCENW